MSIKEIPDLEYCTHCETFNVQWWECNFCWNDKTVIKVYSKEYFYKDKDWLEHLI